MKKVSWSDGMIFIGFGLACAGVAWLFSIPIAMIAGGFGLMGIGAFFAWADSKRRS